MPRALNQPGSSCPPLPPEAGHCPDQTLPAARQASLLAESFGGPHASGGRKDPGLRWASSLRAPRFHPLRAFHIVAGLRTLGH